MRIYIIGPSKGIASITARRYRQAQALIEAQGHVAQNPFALIGRINKERVRDGLPPLNLKTDQEHILRICFRALLKCDAVMLLPDYSMCEKARAERLLADIAHLSIIHAKDESFTNNALERVS